MTERPLDFRSDQFSLGSIVYEMASGRKAFLRRTAVETMSAIVREQPEPLTSLRPDLPLPVLWILERCLSEQGEGTAARPTTYLRSTDGSPALRLSEGWGTALSPDKRWVLAVFPLEGERRRASSFFPPVPGSPETSRSGSSSRSGAHSLRTGTRWSSAAARARIKWTGSTFRTLRQETRGSSVRTLPI